MPLLFGYLSWAGVLNWAGLSLFHFRAAKLGWGSAQLPEQGFSSASPNLGWKGQRLPQLLSNSLTGLAGEECRRVQLHKGSPLGHPSISHRVWNTVEWMDSVAQIFILQNNRGVLNKINPPCPFCVRIQVRKHYPAGIFWKPKQISIGSLTWEGEKFSRRSPRGVIIQTWNTTEAPSNVGFCTFSFSTQRFNSLGF